MNLKQIGISLAATIGLAHAQAGPGKPPAFEVATIKPAAGGEGGSGIRPAGPGRLNVINMTPLSLLTFAYEIKDSQILNAPKWFAADAYDIVGKAEGTFSSADQIRLLLQSLFADRFKLVFHYETRELPVYALVVAKSGAKLQQTKEGSCVVVDLNKMPPPPGPGAPPPVGCGTLQQQVGGTKQALNAFGIGITKPAGGTMGLTTALSNVVGRVVVDKTGLKGIFDFHLEWTPDQPAGPFGPGPAGGAPSEASGDSGKSVLGADAGPSIFIALQEQLGLKLESDKAPVQVLVVDRVERPSEN